MLYNYTLNQDSYDPRNRSIRATLDVMVDEQYANNLRAGMSVNVGDPITVDNTILSSK
jgi:hypothetical protein